MSTKKILREMFWPIIIWLFLVALCWIVPSVWDGVVDPNSIIYRLVF